MDLAQLADRSRKTEGRRPENTRTSDGSHAPRSRISGIPAGGTNGVRAGSDGEERPPVVVLDAGHGGFDPGKIGVDGSLEKEINLQIAKRLKAYLEAEGVEVCMTREDDRGLYAERDSSKKMADMKKPLQKDHGSGSGSGGEHSSEQLSSGTDIRRPGLLLQNIRKRKAPRRNSAEAL